MFEKAVGFVGNMITRINESESMQKVATQVVGGLASCYAVHKLKEFLNKPKTETKAEETK